MQNHAISDGQISALSEWAIHNAAILGRLNSKVFPGSWRAATNDDNQWLQVDLSNHRILVTRVATQGRHNAIHWVTNYTLQYSDDGVNFQYYKGNGQSENKV